MTLIRAALAVALSLLAGGCFKPTGRHTNFRSRATADLWRHQHKYAAPCIVEDER